MKKQMIKILGIIFLMTIVNFTNISLTAYASICDTTKSEPVIEIKQEVKVWYYRKVNGKYQKRLWSETRGIWLTEWIDCKKP